MRHFVYPTECPACRQQIEYIEILYDEVSIFLRYRCKSCRYESEIRATYVTLQSLAA